MTQVRIKPTALHSSAMNALGPTWRSLAAPCGGWRRRARAAALTVLLSLAAALPSSRDAAAAPFIWDQDEDRIDDRIETVHLGGYALAFEEADTLRRKRIDVQALPAGLVYGVYVVFQDPPSPADLIALAQLGMPVLHRYQEIAAVRSVATFAQVSSAAALPSVQRVEAIPILYPVLRDGAASTGVRDPSGQVFPTWSGMGGADGDGIVVAILDTGVNDAPEIGFPGHESLLGRCVGGAVFTYGDSLLDTPRDGTVNPSDHGGDVTNAHGTHVGGIILGSGGATGFATGVAPQARFVDVKVLNDFGVGSGVAEAIDWCIHNRARDWGASDPAFQGIDVINLSLSSLDESDGNDVAARLADRAVQRGMIVVASIGNEGQDHYVPSPAAGDRVVAVGALDTQRSPLNGDDTFAAFSDFGPRAGDGDLDAADEEKPDLLAPGVAVLSADGDLASDGAQYQRLSGTSMAAAFVSGAAAALRSAFPSLTPEQFARVLRSTAYRPLSGVPAGVTGTPGWYSPVGFGAVDLHAALLELVQPERSQVRRLELSGSGSQVTATLRTMRERGAAYFVFERAPDVAGMPGAFVARDSVPASGDSTLADGTNMSVYARAWSVPGNERGTPFWYRVAYTEGGVRWEGPARRFVSPSGPPVATVEVTVVHNAYDNDVDAAIELGDSGSPATLGGSGAASPSLSYPLPGSSAAIASDWVTGSSAGGNVAWTFAIDIPAGSAESYLPPDSGQPWRLRVTEGGFLNRVGRITGYRVVWHSPGGDLVTQGGPLPLQTIEGGTVYGFAPGSPLGVAPPAPRGTLRAGPNPVPGGAAVMFSLASPPRGDLRIYDLAGRQVGRAPFIGGESAWHARWETRDASGHPLRGGLYFARAGEAGMVRLVVLAR